MEISNSLDLRDLKTAYYQSEIGPIEIVGTIDGIVSITFVENVSINKLEVSPCLRECVDQLNDYFEGTRTSFSLKLQLGGTEFQKQVWLQLMALSFGDTKAYGHIAGLIGNPKAVRAVGSASSKNRIAIVIPCHRVIGSDGSLTGYAGGVWRKAWLLRHEKNLSLKFR